MTSGPESFATTISIPTHMLDSKGTTAVSKTVERGGAIWTVELVPGKSCDTSSMANKVLVKISFKHKKFSDEKNFNVIAAGSIALKLKSGSVHDSVPFCLSESSETHTRLDSHTDAELINVKITYRKVWKEASTTTNSSTGKHWSALLESGEGADVVFVVDGVDIPVHTFILGTASPVFKAMFTHETRDKLEKRVFIKGATAAAFKEMLRCVYVDCDPEYKSDAFLLEVNALADRYDIAGLRSRCIRKLADTMTETVLDNRIALCLKGNSNVSQAFMICMLKKMEMSSGAKYKLREHPDLSQYLH